MRVINGNEDGGGVDGDGSGEIPRTGRVPNRHFCPLKLVFDGGGAAEIFVDGSRLL
jgi:hypothetical protein